MRNLAMSSLFLCISAAGCGDDGASGDSGVADAADGGGGACPNAEGGWGFDVSCRSGMGGDEGSFAATVDQSDCSLTLTQMDDATPETWVSTGTVADDGSVELTGEFGFTTITSCTGTTTGSMMSLSCMTADETCEITGMRL
jgi:hypothetical protein